MAQLLNYATRPSRAAKLVRIGKWPVIGLMMVALVVGVFMGYEEKTELDINSGHLRTTRQFFDWRISKKTESSFFSELLDLKAGPPENAWWKTITTDGFRHTHYAYGYAINQMNTIQSVLHNDRFTDPAKKHVAQAVMKSWQSNSGTLHANRYTESLMECAQINGRNGNTIDVEQLPPD